MVDDDRLSPDELEALSAALQGRQKRQRDKLKSRGRKTKLEVSHSKRAESFDLVAHAAGAHYDLPALDLVQEQFALALNALLARATRDEGLFMPVQPRVVNFSEVYASLKMPTGVIICDFAGIGAGGLVLFDPPVLMHIMDLLIGGPGGVGEGVELMTARGFTSTERLLIRRIIGYVDQAMAHAWRDIARVTVSMVRAEVDPRHAAIFVPGDRVVDFGLDVEWGEVTGKVRYVLPMEALRVYEKRLSRTSTAPAAVADQYWAQTITESLMDVMLPVQAVLGETTMTLRQILSLEAGDLLRLDRGPDGTNPVRVQGLTKFESTPTTLGGNMAVQLTERVEPDLTRDERVVLDAREDLDLPTGGAPSGRFWRAGGGRNTTAGGGPSSAAPAGPAGAGGGFDGG